MCVRQRNGKPITSSKLNNKEVGIAIRADITVPKDRRQTDRIQSPIIFKKRGWAERVEEDWDNNNNNLTPVEWSSCGK